MAHTIVLMTANVQGGIIQFTFQLYHILRELGHQVKVCLPYEMHDSDIAEVRETDLIPYHKVKKVLNKHPYHEIAERILAVQPDYIWYCDDSAICSEVGLAIKSKHVKQLLTLHDAGGYHPTHHESLRSRVLQRYVRFMNAFFYQRVYRFVLLSPESGQAFKRRFLKYENRMAMMTLGAHIPAAGAEKPAEIADSMPYLLFFGRIDKYKGIGNLLTAYQAAGHDALTLVIAGNGSFSDEEQEALRTAKNVVLVHRYISDGEMKWLFAHASAVVLPYIEATQSGIIPIAYAYAKPVLVSDIPGLTQFVIDGQTGIVCRSQPEWVAALKTMTTSQTDAMAAAVKAYHDEHFDWRQNVERMLSQL